MELTPVKWVGCKLQHSQYRFLSVNMFSLKRIRAEAILVRPTRALDDTAASLAVRGPGTDRLLAVVPRITLQGRRANPTVLVDIL